MFTTKGRLWEGNPPHNYSKVGKSIAQTDLLPVFCLFRLKYVCSLIADATWPAASGSCCHEGLYSSTVSQNNPSYLKKTKKQQTHMMWSIRSVIDLRNIKLWSILVGYLEITRIYKNCAIYFEFFKNSYGLMVTVSPLGPPTQPFWVREFCSFPVSVPPLFFLCVQGRQSVSVVHGSLQPVMALNYFTWFILDLTLMVIL